MHDLQMDFYLQKEVSVGVQLGAKVDARVGVSNARRLEDLVVKGEILKGLGGGAGYQRVGHTWAFDAAPDFSNG